MMAINGAKRHGSGTTAEAGPRYVMKMLKEDNKAPDFKLPDEEGNIKSLVIYPTANSKLSSAQPESPKDFSGSLLHEVAGLSTTGSRIHCLHK